MGISLGSSMNKTLLVLVRCVKGIEKLAFQFLLALCTDFFCLNKLHNGRSTLAHETRIKESGHADEREHTRERELLLVMISFVLISCLEGVRH